VTISRRPLTNALAIGVVAVLGVSACTSDPGARRVAEDLVRTVAQDEPEIEECMLDVIDQYDEEFGLQDLGDDAQSDNEERSAPAQATLAEFEAELAACDPAGRTRSS
jgi:uncharacterized lipoprotein